MAFNAVHVGHITTGSWEGRGNQYIQLVKVLYCKLPTNGKQLPAFPLEVGPGTEPRSQRWEARVLPLCHRSQWMEIKISWIAELKNTQIFLFFLPMYIHMCQTVLKCVTDLRVQLANDTILKLWSDTGFISVSVRTTQQTHKKRVFPCIGPLPIN